MPVVGTVTVACPACGIEQDCELIQSINSRSEPAAKTRLLRGDLNVLACACGRRTGLAADLLYVDPDAGFYCQVVASGSQDMAEAAARFADAGVTGTLRLVPSKNALVEKVRILDAGLADWAVEMAKVLPLAARQPPALDRVLLFDGVDRSADKVRWLLLPVDPGDRAVPLASALVSVERLAERTRGQPGPAQLQVDRAWAVEAVRTMVEGAS